MVDLLKYILEGITGSKNFSVEEVEEGDRIMLNIKADKEIVGQIIGKEGNTIRSIQNIINIKARLENKIAGIKISEA